MVKENLWYWYTMALALLGCGNTYFPDLLTGIKLFYMTGEISQSHAVGFSSEANTKIEDCVIPEIFS
jgi:hypothetical protein